MQGIVGWKMFIEGRRRSERIATMICVIGIDQWNLLTYGAPVFRARSSPSGSILFKVILTECLRNVEKHLFLEGPTIMEQK